MGHPALRAPEGTRAADSASGVTTFGRPKQFPTAVVTLNWSSMPPAGPDRIHTLSFFVTGTTWVLTTRLASDASLGPSWCSLEASRLKLPFA